MTYSAPLLKVAGLNVDSVKIYLIHDPELNAFVAGGQNIFFNTGIFLMAENVGQLIGIIAHEIAHIAGGHLARTKNAIESAQTINKITSILGASMGLLTGQSEVAAAAIAGGSDVANRTFLTFSRTQESSADHAALKYLEATKQSAIGMRDFLILMQGQERYHNFQQDPYLLTHPLSSKRIKSIEQHIKNSKYSNTPYPPNWQRSYLRIQAKIFAYSNPLPVVLQRYPETDRRVHAQYARAFAYYLEPNLSKALRIIDELIEGSPQDPYFHELRGQMLFEHGRVNEAIISYELAVKYASPSGILFFELGKALIASNDDELLKKAETMLKKSLVHERNVPATWRQLAVTFGRQGKMGLTWLCLAEEAVLIGRLEDATHNAKKAIKILPPGSREWLQAQDLIKASSLKTHQ